MKKYFKLGKHASVFFDAKSRLKISNKEVAAIEVKKVTKKINDAVANGHLVEATEQEFEASEKAKKAFMDKASKVNVTVSPENKKNTGSPDPAEEDEDEDEDEDGLEDMTKDQLISYAEENLDGISEEEIEKFKKMKKDEMIEFIREW